MANRLAEIWQVVAKIKLKKSGIHIVYKIERLENEMIVIVIGFRRNLEVYKIAEERIKSD